MRILGLDVGTKRTGVAISDPTLTIATSLKTITTGDHKELAVLVNKICEEYEVGKIVVGYPINMNGTKGAKVKEIEEFSDYLRFRTKLPVVYEDERLTTEEAMDTVKALGKKIKDHKKSLDRIAATIILQSYLNSL